MKKGVKPLDNQDKLSFPTEHYQFQPGSLCLLNPIPCGLDAKIRDVCGAFAQLREEGRRTFSSTLSTADFDELRFFAMRSAVFALREQDADLVRHGLIALAMIEEEREDFRDLGIGLSLLYYTAYRIGQDPDQVFRAAADLADPGVAEMMVRITQEKTKGAKPSAGIFGEVQTRFGAGFVETYFNRYEPRLDLLSIALGIAGVVDRDCYRTDSIHRAGYLPDVWFDREDQDLLKSTLARVRGVINLHARLYPAKHPDEGRQLFIVFLAELEEPESAGRLVQLSQSTASPHSARLAIAVDCLFCLITARSGVYGVESFEQDDSLVRFRPGIETVMNEGVQLGPTHA